MPIIITQNDIDNGIPGDMLRDPVAIALKRTTGVPWRVDKVMCYPDNGKHKPFVTPRQVNRFIEAFDDGKPVAPFSFDIK